jgi:ankyrin repeat protein
VTDKANSIDVIKLLLARGANPNVQLKLRPPYRNAVQDRNADATLISGATPLMRAATGGDVEVVKLLLEAGALVDLPIEDGTTPLMAAVSASGTRGKNKTEEQALACVECHTHGRKRGARSNRGLTAAHSAALRGWDNAENSRPLRRDLDAGVRQADAAGLRHGPQPRQFLQGSRRCVMKPPLLPLGAR